MTEAKTKVPGMFPPKFWENSNELAYFAGPSEKIKHQGMSINSGNRAFRERGMCGCSGNPSLWSLLKGSW